MVDDVKLYEPKATPFRVAEAVSEFADGRLIRRKFPLAKSTVMDSGGEVKSATEADGGVRLRSTRYC